MDIESNGSVRAGMAERDSEHPYRALFDSIDDGFCTIKVLFDDEGGVRDYRFLLTNPAFERQTGLIQADGRTMRELAPDHEEFWFDIYGQVALTGEPVRFAHQADALGGRWYEVHAFRIGVVEERQVAIIFRDIRDKKQAEAALRESEVQYRALFDSIDEGACIIERLPVGADGLRDYRYIAMNKAMQAMFGIADLSGRTIREFFPDEVEDWYDDYDRVLTTGEPVRFVRESEPQEMVLEMFVSRISEKPPRVLAVMQDITKRKRAEEALRRSEERSRALVNASSDVVFRMSPDWQEMRQLDGRGSPLRCRGPTVRWMDDHLFPEDLPQIRMAIAHAIRERRPFELEHRVRRADGEVGWTFSRAIPVFDARGEIAEWFGMAADVTERVHARQRQQMLNHELGHRLKNVAEPRAIDRQPDLSPGRQSRGSCRDLQLAPRLARARDRYPDGDRLGGCEPAQPRPGRADLCRRFQRAHPHLRPRSRPCATTGPDADADAARACDEQLEIRGAEP